MKYENAKDILPAKLLEEVQKYAEGKLIYIPKVEKPKGWGEASGYRDKLNKRNSMICSRYSAGHSIMEIAEEFYLSPETIKKLVYGKKVKLPMYSPSIASAQQYAAVGMGEEWMRTYLNSLNETIPDISEYFMTDLVKIPLRLIEDREFEKSEEEPESFYDVPLVVFFEKKKFYVPFQLEYLDYLRKEKTNAHHAFVFAKNDEYGYFWENFGKNFRR